MALETLNTYIVYKGKGDASKTYPIDFEFLEPQDIRLVVKTAAGALVPGPEFTVNHFASGTGELVTADFFDNTYDIIISRETPAMQPLNLTDGALLSSESLERALDRLTMIAQETRTGVVASQVASHRDTHRETGNDALVLAQSQITGLTAALTAKAGAADFTAHAGDLDNPHEVTATQLGLGALNNTSDADKPISTAQQAALDTKADKLLATHEITEGDYTLILTDANCRVTTNDSSEHTITIPLDEEVAFPIGTQILVQQLGEGLTLIDGEDGVVIRSRGEMTALAGQYAVGVLIKDGTDTWTFTGDRA
jgi:hypothetical protein